MRTVLVFASVLLTTACGESPTSNATPPLGSAGMTVGGSSGSTGDMGGSTSVSGSTSTAGSSAAGADTGAMGGTANAGSDAGGTSAGGMAGGVGSGGTAAMPSEEIAMLLSETGLYSDIATETLAPGVQWFQPQFPLWSDGSDKNRWLWLPAGTQIDTSDMDNWAFPIGTKIWKEFVRDGVRVETRLIERFGTGGRRWKMIAYIWNEEGTDAVASPMGQEDAGGTEHDVPSEQTCKECHDNRADKPIGVSAVQLAHDLDGMNLTTMIADGMLSAPPPTALVVPGDELARQALGYLHGNCGGCHRDESTANSRVDVRMWLEVGSMGAVETTDAYTQLVNQHVVGADSLCETNLRIFGGDPDRSEILRRMSQAHRSATPMPPVGSELEDSEAIQLLSEWISSLPSGEDVTFDPCCSNADETCCNANPDSPSCP